MPPLGGVQKKSKTKARKKEMRSDEDARLVRDPPVLEERKGWINENRSEYVRRLKKAISNKDNYTDAKIVSPFDRDCGLCSEHLRMLPLPKSDISLCILCREAWFFADWGCA